MKLLSITDNRIFWVLTIVFAAIALVFFVIAGIYVDTDSASRLSAVVKQFADNLDLAPTIIELDILVTNGAVAGVLVADNAGRGRPGRPAGRTGDTHHLLLASG